MVIDNSTSMCEEQVALAAGFQHFFSTLDLHNIDPRIAVTVDMISTGTDIKPLECLLFLRMIRSQGYFEQMKGRGTRVISATDLTAVTPDAAHKTHFVLVDAVGVCEQDMTDSKPMEKKPTVSFEKLLQAVSLGNTEEDVLMHNDGKGVFTDVARRSGPYFSEKYVGRGTAYADYDNDGDLDLAVANWRPGGPNKVYRNHGGNLANTAGEPHPFHGHPPSP